MANSIIVELTMQNGEYLAKVQQAERATKRYGDSTKSSLAVAAIAFNQVLEILSRVGRAIKYFIDASFEQARATARVEQVIRSTGGAAGITAEQVQELATQMQSVTAFADEVTMTGQALLLTFTNIGRDVFPQATEAMLNMSTALDQDVSTSAMQLGKALNDPIRGITQLRRVGVQFTADQERQIRNFVRTNDVAGAQRVILRELETEFGGMARAIASTPEGKFTQLKNDIGEIAEKIGDSIVRDIVEVVDQFKLAVKLVSELGRMIADAATDLNSWLHPLDTLSRIASGINISGSGVNLENPADELLATYTNFQRRRGRGGAQSEEGGGGSRDASDRAKMERQRNYQDKIDQENNVLTEIKNRELEASEYRIKTAENTYTALTGLATGYANQIQTLSNIETNTRLTNIDKLYNRQKAWIVANVADENERNRQLEVLETQKEFATKIAKRKGAKTQKDISIFEAITSTLTGAIGAAKAMAGIPYVGPILAGIAAAAFAGMGMAIVSKISRQPLPELYEGGIIPGSPGGTHVVAGERGQTEAIMSLDKLDKMMGNRVIQLVVDGKVLTEVVDNHRSRRAYSMNASNYLYAGAYR